jgi:hypothetical protein
MKIAAVLLCFATIPVLAVEPERSVTVGTEEIRGAALDERSGSLYTWGDKVRRWDLRTLQSEVLATGWFGEGGCVADFGLVLYEGPGLGKLVWYGSTGWKRHELDTEIEMHDCAAATLFGRKGVLMIQRFMQMRFYQPTGEVQDVYSFYTASEQAGIAFADVDGDGRQDILSGNYWIRSPERFEEPWRLFAINTIHQTPKSARFRLALLEPADALVAAQGEMEDAQLILFRKPPNPRDQWRQIPLGEGLRIAYPHGLLATDLDGDGKTDFVLGENNGAASRLFAFRNLGDDRFASSLLETGHPSVAIFRAGANLIVAGPHEVSLWSVRRPDSPTPPGP